MKSVIRMLPDNYIEFICKECHINEDKLLQLADNQLEKEIVQELQNLEEQLTSAYDENEKELQRYEMIIDLLEYFDNAIPKTCELEAETSNWPFMKSDLLKFDSTINVAMLQEGLWLKTRKCWELIAFPIMRDKRIAIIFENTTEIDEGIEYSYCIDLFNIEPEICYEESIKLTFKNRHLSTLEGDREHLRFLCWENNGDCFLGSIGEETDFIVPIGKHICISETNTNGEIIIGYACEEEEFEQFEPVKFYDIDGKYIKGVKNSISFSCLNIESDEDGVNWFNFYPGNKLYKIQGDSIKEYTVEVAGFNGFFLSSDENKLFTQFFEDGRQCCYVLEKKDNAYVNAVNFSKNCDEIDGNSIATYGKHIACLHNGLLYIGKIL